MLPVETLKEQIISEINSGRKRFIISAPTASGKSTKLPQIFSEALPAGSIIVLQPRRVAARFLASTVAKQQNATLGKEVGWHIRFEKNYTSETKIIFLTEGILARKILQDSKLHGVSAIIFDEFHERNIFSDITLSLAMQAQETLRKDLVICVCSASMDERSLGLYLGKDALTLSCDSRLYDIDISYSPQKSQSDFVWDRAAKEFDTLVKKYDSGNFLIFMPGIYEINKTIRAILNSPSSKNILVMPLYGDMPASEQDKTLRENSKRKVIVATNIAETSLTIEGVKFVIDSGLARVARYDSSRGVNTLLVERISLASATQRAGRAGRNENGIAIRLWDKRQETSFEEFSTPEIKRLDLSQILLWLKSSNISLDELNLFENPTDEALLRASELLKNTHSIDSQGHITKDGILMSRMPTEVRYAKLLVEAAKRNCLGEIALMIGAMESGRIKMQIANQYKEREIKDILSNAKSEIEELLILCELAKSNNFDEQFCRDYGIHSQNARKAFFVAKDLFNQARNCEIESLSTNDEDAIAKCILSAFSDHLCTRLNDTSLACNIVNSRRGEITKDSRSYAKNLFCALDLQERHANGKVAIIASLCTPIKEDFLREIFPENFSIIQKCEFDKQHKRVISKECVQFKDLIISEKNSDKVSEEDAAKILLEEILNGNLRLENFNEKVENFITRVNFISELFPEYGIPKIDEEAKKIILSDLCFGKFSHSQMKDIAVLPAFKNWLSEEQLSMLEYLAPEFVRLENRKIPLKIIYDLPMRKVIISSYFKDFFDFDSHKLQIAEGKILPTYEILAPNKRPIQTTQNLENFWTSSWITIKKELKARYPKHFKDE